MFMKKNKLKDADRRAQAFYNNLRRDNEQWLQSVVDTKLEYAVNQEINSEAGETMKLRIFSEAKLDYVSDEMVVMGLLAQNAKVPKYIAERGICSNSVFNLDEQKRWLEQRKFLIWYDKELGHNDFREPLLFVKNEDRDRLKQDIYAQRNEQNWCACPIALAQTSHPVCGRYFWVPMRREMYLYW